MPFVDALSLIGLPNCFSQVCDRHHPAVGRQELLHIQLQPFDVRLEIQVAGVDHVDGRRQRHARRGRRKGIGLVEQLLFRQVDQQEPRIVPIALAQVEFQTAAAVRQDVLIR